MSVALKESGPLPLPLCRAAARPVARFKQAWIFPVLPERLRLGPPRFLVPVAALLLAGSSSGPWKRCCGDRGDRFDGGGSCTRPGGGDCRGRGGWSRAAGHLLPGPGVPDRLCRQAADSRRGGLLLPRSPGQADRVPGAVRADRGEVPPGHQGLGSGQRRPGDAVQGWGAQGRCHGPVPGRRCRSRAVEGGGHRVCPGVPVCVDGA